CRPRSCGSVAKLTSSGRVGRRAERTMTPGQGGIGRVQGREVAHDFGPSRDSHRQLEAHMRRAQWAPALVVAALLISACQPSSTGGGGAQKPAKLTIAAVQGNEDAALKAVAPLYEQKTGIKIEIVEFCYVQHCANLLTTFKANSPTYDLVMMDDP